MKFWLPLSLIAFSLQANDLPLPKAIFPIDHKSRTSDIVQAYELLRRDKPTLKITLRTAANVVFPNVTELTAAAGGTLLFVRNVSQQGSKYTILPVEEVAEISYSN